MIRFIKLYWLDILNYLYFRRVVGKFKNTETWNKLSFRQNRIGEVYSVVRLRDEDLGDPDEIMTTRLMEACRERNIFIADMDVQFAVGGLVTVDYFFIPDDPNAFLVLWQPKLQVMSLGNTVKFLLILITIFSILGIGGYYLSSFLLKM